ncbi:MAG: SRPBCC domain-containing protein [Flavobacteriales bacterium]|nr:SRPBCC domain-containing protein [Flavobacteriales bacterium]
MGKLTYEISIHASARKVYENMLGLKNKNSYEYWVSVFNPTSTYEGSWDLGSRIYFVGTDENGKRGGMISEIVAHQPAEFVSIRHVGFLDGDVEVTSGEMVEKWAGGHENYTYQERDGVTTVLVEMDSVEEYMEFFNSTYPLALQKLKAISESD